MISVIIPTYNRRSFLAKAVDSVRRQTVRDWELIVVDDGSQDGSADWVDSLKDERIRCLRQPNRGVSAARNRALKEASRPWIALLDSDDRWRPDKLRRQMEYHARHPHTRVLQSEEIWIRNGRRVNPKKIHRKYDGWIYRRCLPLCVVSPSAVMVHCSVFEDVGLFREDFPVCEDYELWLRIACRYPIRLLEEPLTVKYGGHEDQLSRSRWGMDRFRLKALRERLASGDLSPQAALWTAREVVRKAEILAQGFDNNQKPQEADRYRQIARRTQSDFLGRWTGAKQGDERHA
ncbi:MAG TPA: glycosyltransferase [Acidobacteriota bacterium]|nr:glycosyltransferase [Acidobacteriota bacterium]